MTKALAHKLLPLTIISSAIGLAAGMVLIASAQTPDAATEVAASSVPGITFPIAELGNCADKDACRAYCEEPGNMDACVEFSKKQGLVTGAEAERGKAYAAQLRGEGGPGGCKSPAECKAFCSNVANVNACIDFAKKHKLSGERTKEAERLAAYLKAGGTTPGRCDSAETCRMYCSDLINANECRTFAEKIGLTTSQGKNAVPPGQFQKLSQMAREGKTPGGCTTAEGCKTYCADAANRNECIEFGRASGLLDTKRADALERTGGVGPGGCTTAEACREFCNVEANRDTCFKFAEEHDLISKEDLKKAEDGLVRFRQGFNNAPPEVIACLRAHVGQNIVDDIQSGKLTPGPEIGERVKGCFERFGKKVDTTEELKRAPGSVVACLREKVGDRYSLLQSGRATMTPEIADSVRVCHESAKLFMELSPGMPGTRVATGTPQKPVHDVRLFMRSAPEAIQSCIREATGGVLENLAADQAPPEGVVDAVKKCYEAFRPVAPTARPMNVLPLPPATQTSPALRLAPAILSCLKQNLSSGDYESILKGIKPGSAESIITKCMQANPTPMVKPPGTAIPIPKPPVSPTSNTGAYRPAVLACLKDNLPPADYDALLRGVKPAGVVEILEDCQQTGATYVPPAEDDGVAPPPPPPPAPTTTTVPGATTVPPPANTLTPPAY